MLSLFHREEGEEGLVDPRPPAKERDRSHSKTKKTRRERRHTEREAETTASATPPVSMLQSQTGVEPQTQVQTGQRSARTGGVLEGKG